MNTIESAWEIQVLIRYGRNECKWQTDSIRMKNNIAFFFFFFLRKVHK